jgi:hypothetical protein
MIERALLPVQRKRTLKMRSVMDSNLPRAARGKIGDQRRAYVRTAAAAILEEEQRDFAEPGEIGAVDDRAAVPLSNDLTRAGENGEMRRHGGQP